MIEGNGVVAVVGMWKLCTFGFSFSVNLKLVKNKTKIKPIKKRKENIFDFIYFHVSKYSFFDSVKSTFSLFIQK